MLFSAAAGASPSINGIIGFRAGWGVGNALFIATSLAVIVASASGGFAAGRMVAEYASTIGASTIVVGASTHGGLPALMDGSASRELWRHARSNVLVVNPDAPDGVPAKDLWRELAND